ncbi:MAG: hypothetical protein ACRD5W_15080 [Candidatus Acidiferrales bacterium]
MVVRKVVLVKVPVDASVLVANPKQRPHLTFIRELFSFGRNEAHGIPARKAPGAVAYEAEVRLVCGIK